MKHAKDTLKQSHRDCERGFLTISLLEILANLAILSLI